MAEKTGIVWTDSTFNPWIGCTKVGPGCDNCYASVSTPARSMHIVWGAGQPRHRTAKSNWQMVHTWEKHHDAFALMHGRRRRVFCASLADVFDNEVPPAWRADLFALIEATPHLDWLLLTKRIGNVRPMMMEVARSLFWMDKLDTGELPGNVWLGATVVNQAEFDRDMPKLDATPAAIRFLSVEPMLGPIVDREGWLWGTGGKNGVDWVICGGESGPGARPMHVSWARSLMEQCKASGVPFHMKQLGAQPRGWCAAALAVSAEDREDLDDDFCDLYEAHECGKPCEGCVMLNHPKGGDAAEWPEDLRVREFPV